jgi:hypothetical protein
MSLMLVYPHLYLILVEPTRVHLLEVFLERRHLVDLRLGVYNSNLRIPVSNDLAQLLEVLQHTCIYQPSRRSSSIYRPLSNKYMDDFTYVNSHYPDCLYRRRRTRELVGPLAQFQLIIVYLRSCR